MVTYKFWSWCTGWHQVGCQKMCFFQYAEPCGQPGQPSGRSPGFPPTERARCLTQGHGRHLDDILALGHDNIWNNWTELASVMEIKLLWNDIRPPPLPVLHKHGTKATAKQPSNGCFPSMIGNSPCWPFYLVMTIYFSCLVLLDSLRQSVLRREWWQAKALLASQRGPRDSLSPGEYGRRLFLL